MIIVLKVFFMMINVNYTMYVKIQKKWNMCFLKENQHPIVAQTMCCSALFRVLDEFIWRHKMLHTHTQRIPPKRWHIQVRKHDPYDVFSVWF